MARPKSKPPSLKKPATPEPVSPIDVDRVDRNIRESLRKQVVELINKHPKLALSVIRGWLHSNDNNK